MSSLQILSFLWKPVVVGIIDGIFRSGQRSEIIYVSIQLCILMRMIHIVARSSKTLEILVWSVLFCISMSTVNVVHWVS